MESTELRECKARLGMTLDSMSAELGISRRLLAYMLKGTRPVPRYIELACKALENER